MASQLIYYARNYARKVGLFRFIYYYARIVGQLGLLGIANAVKGRISRRPELFKKIRSDIKFPFYLRVPSSDVQTYMQVFFSHMLDFDVKKQPGVIIDAGANIGLASIYFSNRFPEAKIFAIEPEESNFKMLSMNVAPYHNIKPIHAALWNENKEINLVDPGFGNWGFMTQENDGKEEKFGEQCHTVQGMTVEAIMKAWEIEHIDVLKIDIEGAEREVFYDPSLWIEHVDALVVEIHERLKPGCNSSFYSGAKGFDAEWRQGENIYLSRNKGCLVNRI